MQSDGKSRGLKMIINLGYNLVFIHAFCIQAMTYVNCIATINSNLFFIYHLWIHMTLQMSNYSYSALCLYLLVDLWNRSLSAATTPCC